MREKGRRIALRQRDSAALTGGPHARTTARATNADLALKPTHALGVRAVCQGGAGFEHVEPPRATADGERRHARGTYALLVGRVWTFGEAAREEHWKRAGSR